MYTLILWDCEDRGRHHQLQIQQKPSGRIHSSGSTADFLCGLTTIQWTFFLIDKFVQFFARDWCDRWCFSLGSPGFTAATRCWSALVAESMLLGLAHKKPPCESLSAGPCWGSCTQPGKLWYSYGKIMRIFHGKNPLFHWPFSIANCWITRG